MCVGRLVVVTAFSVIIPVSFLLSRFPVRDAASLVFLSDMVDVLFNPHIRKEGCEHAGALIENKNTVERTGVLVSSCWSGTIGA